MTYPKPENTQINQLFDHIEFNYLDENNNNKVNLRLKLF